MTPDPTLEALARELVDVLDDSMLAMHLAARFTCTEFAPLHNLIAHVRPEAAKVWAVCHAGGDDGEDDCMHDRWLELHNESRLIARAEGQMP